MCYGRIFTSLLTLLINMFYTSKQVEISLYNLIKDLMPVLCISIFMFIVVYFVSSFFDSVFLQLFIGILLGGIVYCGLAYLFKIKELNYISELFNLIKLKLWN